MTLPKATVRDTAARRPDPITALPGRPPLRGFWRAAFGVDIERPRGPWSGGEADLQKASTAAAATIAAFALLIVPAPAQVQPYQANDYGGFRSILPPGTKGSFNATDFAAFQLGGTYPPHATDQLSMYEDLVYATPGLTAAQIPNYFKDASFGVPAGQAERTYSPRAGVTIVRDSAHGQAHVYGVTRSDTIFGAGYASAEDRLFFMDVLRHAGRGQLSGFAGGANKAMDADVWSNAPYTEADLQLQIDMADDYYGAEGAALRQDLVDYVAGINQYISEARTGSHQAAVRVRGDRQAARGLAGHRRDRDRGADRRHLRQGRRQRARQRRRARGGKGPLRRRRGRAGVARLPPPGRPGGADHGEERQRVLRLPADARLVRHRAARRGLAGEPAQQHLHPARARRPSRCSTACAACPGCRTRCWSRERRRNRGARSR